METILDFIYYMLFKSLFKSYYVVWKLTWSEKHTARKQCLNRTMYYGNERLCDGIVGARESLNRTM